MAESYPPVQAQPNRRGLPMPTALFLLAVTLVLVFGSRIFQSVWANRHRSTAYQAIFLTSGQVYFGKLERLTEQELVIVKVYYLQAIDNPQQTSSAKSNANTNTSTPAPQYSLIKLGGELHGPQDRMYINRSQVLFTEDLQDSSQVVTAIRQQQK